MANDLIKKLIDNKVKIDGERNKEHSYFVNSQGVEFKYKKASRVELVRAQSMENEEIDPYVVFTHVTYPNLADDELQAAYNKEGQPHEIVDALLDAKEVNELSRLIAGIAKPKDLSKEIKN
ncbi:hypothetical protein CB452P1_000017 [Clostridium phage CB452P1]|nr:hypothetical protein CB452P1_000017 [Clostridium phage CB452P1]